MHNMRIVGEKMREYSLRDSISVHFEKLLRVVSRGGWEGFGEGEVHAIKHTLFMQELIASHEEQSSP